MYATAATPIEPMSKPPAGQPVDFMAPTLVEEAGPRWSWNESGEHAQAAPQADPSTDFIAWVQRLPHLPDPSAALLVLRRHHNEPHVVRASERHLRRLMVEDVAGTELLFAVACVGSLRSAGSVDDLKTICALALDALEREGTLPPIEAHLATAALWSLAGADFDSGAEWARYEQRIDEVERAGLDYGDGGRVLAMEALQRSLVEELREVLGPQDNTQPIDVASLGLPQPAPTQQPAHFTDTAPQGQLAPRAAAAIGPRLSLLVLGALAWCDLILCFVFGPWMLLPTLVTALAGVGLWRARSWGVGATLIASAAHLVCGVALVLSMEGSALPALFTVPGAMAAALAGITALHRRRPRRPEPARLEAW